MSAGVLSAQKGISLGYWLFDSGQQQRERDHVEDRTTPLVEVAVPSNTEGLS